MARPGQELTGPSGDSLRFVRTTAEAGGELLEVEAAYRPNSKVPPQHYHPFQTERFEVLAGTMRARIAGKEFTYAAGDRFEIPPGVVHTMHNVGDRVARMRWQIRPALRTEEFFEAIWSKAGKGRKSGMIRLATILQAHDQEFRLARPPYLVQKSALAFLAALAKLTRRGRQTSGLTGR